MALTPLNVIGKIENHDQGAMAVLTGKADFYGDRLPNAKFYGAIKTSTIAKGNIKSIDAAKALAVPGVKGVMTYKECPAWKQGIFYWGQEVAGVVADDFYTALYACTLIDVQYDVQTAAIDPDEAMKPGAPLAGIRPDTNVATPTNLVRGDVAAGMAAADVTLETSFGWTTCYQHNTLEPHGTVAWWIGDDVYVWTGSQAIHGGRSTVVSTLGIPANKVHCFTHYTGGGHGDKTSAVLGAPAAILSKMVDGAPVQLMETRKENVLCNTRMFAVRSNIKWGAKKDGTITAVDAQWYGDAGSNANAPIAAVNYGLKNTYKIPNAAMKVTTVVTNTPQRGYWRCVNDPPGMMNANSALDKLAEKLDMNPWDLRMKNLMPADARDQDAPNRVWGGGGAGVSVKMCFDKVYAESGYSSKWHKPGTKTLPDGRLHGIAITGHIDSHGGVNGASRGGMVTMCPDGTALVNVGGARGCSGGPTMCCHVVAETLGMKYADVRLGDWGNTDISLDAGIQAGSGFTGGAGSAFTSAARDLRKKLFAAAITKTGLKEIAGITPDDLDAKDSVVFYTKDPTKKLTYRQVMSGTPPTAGVGNGWASTLITKTIGDAKLGDACNSTGGAAACAEVAVDPETGEVEVLGLWNGVDTGRTIFKQGTMKEMNSGNELMVWQALIAGDTYDWATGALISSLWTEGQMLTTMDCDPTKYSAYDIESDDAAGPYGAHGIGEPCVTNYSAIVCAIFNATGKWVDPDKGACSANKVLKALGKA